MTYTYMELIDQVGHDFYRSEDQNKETLKRWSVQFNAWMEAWPFETLQELTLYVTQAREIGEEVSYVEVTEDDVR